MQLPKRRSKAAQLVFAPAQVLNTRARASSAVGKLVEALCNELSLIGISLIGSVARNIAKLTPALIRTILVAD